MNEKFYQQQFDGYSGTKRFSVTHPRHIDTVVVAAPDENAAIISAAKFWGERWQSLDFYSLCTVVDGDLRASRGES
jgi:hypothetical protein